MNKGGFFALGLLFGAVLGGTGTYFAVKKTFANRASDAIEAYAEYAEEKIAKIEEKYGADHDEDDLDE